MFDFESVATKITSFIIATKDRASFLAKTLDNVREFKQSEDELIVVDGLSKDNTIDIIQKNSDIIDIFLSEKDKNDVHAFNKGILLSHGKYIKILSDDDVIHPDGMKQAIQVMENNLEIDILLCGGTRQRGAQCKPVYIPQGVNYGKNVEDVFKYGCCGVGMLIRRRTFALAGLLNTSATPIDIDFVPMCISKGLNVKFCRINLFHHQVEDHSTTIKRFYSWELDMKRITKQYGLKRYYYRYIVSKQIKKYPKIIFIVNFLWKKRIEKEQDCIWDGGFS